MANFTTNQAEWYADVPRSVTKHVIIGMLLMIVTFGGFGLWAFRAPLAAAVISQGSFVATGKNQIIQHLEGGIIEDILVSEGQKVEVGQLLVKLDQTASSANEHELFLRRIRLEATEARLLAEHNGDRVLQVPPTLLEQRGDSEVASILDSQVLSFQVSQNALQNDLSLLDRNIDALDIRQIGYKTQLGSHEQQLELLAGDLTDKEAMLARGLARRAEVTALKRAIIEAKGQIGRLEAEVNEIDQVKLRYQAQKTQATDRYRQTALSNLQLVQSELDSVREQSRTATNVRERADVVSQVAGTVVRLHYHTAGGVVESGRPILEILPANQPLIIEIHIPRADIDSVREGQSATVRLTALNQRTTPVLEGEVFYVSADSITDTSTGIPAEVYVARISLAPDQMRRVANFTPTPGMPAEIMIQTAERTFAQYLAKPVKDSMTRAFREN